ncbi:MAG: Flp pilus assembly complex ATPase component TadA [Nanoarchaeota archaeon]|nr:Flp pilus assembly complex ATPase component TadA [Nanoarchaeota archaeon]MBU1321981.1 Flp pilus assembly complex ATPase component TadA [Nanoarchaeota archaeon]MBU1597633.1 Flp pilus assembly complex ATPase component TadA [Nanoarchaeota archaeon]MBU2442037.1 Flp pilus assembly complex ATPase component TadA [Nanoarchaeota archaeon]
MTELIRKTHEELARKELIDRYTITVNNIVVDISIYSEEERPVPEYIVSITNISDATKIILEKIRQEFISKMNLEEIESLEQNELINIRQRFKGEIKRLIHKYFPQADAKTINMLINYLIEENLGLGKIEILLQDPALEEIVINNHKDPVWVYHRKHGWLITNIKIVTEARIRHFATMIGRDIGKEITNLSPLMDAHLLTGDRVNATLGPISTKGNTITIRKFSQDPWTISKFIQENVLSVEAAALIWLAVQNELSVLISGGTGSGKTSMLNVISNFFPPNQRIISIEDTRELTLPGDLHWVPMETRLANPEGKGGVSMLDLLVNSLRMRPDRIIVGEIRRKREAEVLLEAMHTGHSVYGTIHANNAEEVVTRLTNSPIEIPKPMIASLSMIVIQNRNRRTGKRRTLQVAEITPTGDARILIKLNVNKDTLEQVAKSETMLERLKLYTGMTDEEIDFDLKEKVRILKWMVKKEIFDVNEIGMIIAKYYMGTLRMD